MIVGKSNYFAEMKLNQLTLFLSFFVNAEVSLWSFRGHQDQNCNNIGDIFNRRYLLILCHGPWPTVTGSRQVTLRPSLGLPGPS